VKTDMQIRSVATEFDIRSTGDGGNTLVGHAAVFNSPTVIAGLFREQIAPRAFKKSLKESDIRALFNHDTNIVLGRNKAGTLRLSEDLTGLAYEIDLPDTQAARDLWTSIERGDISQSSFAFETVKEARESADPENGEPLPLITVREAKLYDVSPVVYPAYEDTDVSARVLMRCADLSGHTIEEVRAAYESGETARLWTPTHEDDSEPQTRSDDIEDQSLEPPEEPTPEPSTTLSRRDSALREIELIELS